MKYDDLTGKRFGKLVAMNRIYDPVKKITLWECKCDCGNIAIVRANRLKHGRTKSCGCLRKDSNVLLKTTHGMSYSHLYNTWHSIKGRCYNKNYRNYHYYGARGISMCEEWKNSFEAFSEWSYSNGYEEGLSIDRINNDGNYCPENCRWVSLEEQNNNRRVSINITYNGKTQNLAEWCRQLNIPYIRVWQRIVKYGYTFEEAINEPSHNRSGKSKKEI